MHVYFNIWPVQCFLICHIYHWCTWATSEQCCSFWQNTGPSLCPSTRSNLQVCRICRSSNLRFTKDTVQFGVCYYTYVSVEWTPDREHCLTVCAYLFSSFTWWRLFLVRGHLLLLHFDGQCPYTVCLWGQLQKKCLAGWSLYKENHKMWWKRVQNIEPVWEL